MASSSRVNQQSIRSSCDRCRFQKLKCTVLIDAEKCERCARAKVDCVFSRRAKARRLSDTQNQNVMDKRSSGHKHMPDPRPMELGSISPVILDSFSESRVNNDYPLLDSQLRYRGTWDSSPFGGHGSDIAIDEIAHNMLYDREALGDYQPDHGRAEDNLFNFAVPSSFPDRHASQPTAPFGQEGGRFAYPRAHMPQGSHSHHGGDPGRDSPTTGSEDGSSHAIPRLSALVAEIYETCGMLKDSHWAANMHNPAAMNDYPIGRVLHLSQEFTHVLQNMAWTTGRLPSSDLDPMSPSDCVDPQISSSYPSSAYGLAIPISNGSVIGQSAGILEAGLQERAAFASRQSPSPAGCGLIDAPVMLLVLSCFISLTKLYGIVFTHFESHLSGLPPASLSTGSAADIGLIRSRGLQLGELPLLDETYSKTYTGVRMLLDTFQSAEDVIGLPDSLSIIRGSAYQRTEGELSAPTSELRGTTSSPWMTFQGELALAMLKQDALIGGSSVHEGFHDLSMKIQSLKRMLREKMHL
ncbi:hypothetical protein SLS62_009360 [Diatrype stigma]|uniref:Zn(2)-C6 fungal-type domain-containing protein n=1 Tax=Diatrype stigma TaxID=117547 RepID=A0AAN9UF91_9PEZI